jgi:hypothetical protein
MFGKGKGSSHEKDELLPPAPQLQDLTSANLAESDSTEISCIGPGKPSTRNYPGTSVNLGLS